MVSGGTWVSQAVRPPREEPLWVNPHQLVLKISGGSYGFMVFWTHNCPPEKIFVPVVGGCLHRLFTSTSTCQDIPGVRSLGMYPFGDLRSWSLRTRLVAGYTSGSFLTFVTQMPARYIIFDLPALCPKVRDPEG